MRAFVITGPGAASVRDVDPPVAGPGEVVVDVERAGVCGTDLEFFSGEMAYLHTGDAEYPVRIGHEWCGVVTSAGSAEGESWIGKRVTGDTMLGCGRCARCTSGRQHTCADRYEIGIRHGWPGALAEQLRVPVGALHEIPAGFDLTMGAMVEPGANAMRAHQQAAGSRILVMGPGTIGLLVASFAAAAGAEVHLLGLKLDFARSLGFADVWTADDLPDLPFDTVVDCSTAASLPAKAVELVEPGGRVVFLGIAEEPSLIDTRQLALKDVTAVGVLSGSGALRKTIDVYASGAVDPRPLVAATVGLDEAVNVLAGHRDPAWGEAPKVHIDPRR
ncbi:alcohol dehydrogenase catalytic domain-containing protein [Actinoplanes sp. NPDC051633]|uniref:zinc-dependent alcohol dehydrogenase n=1 Tax=Actinoplanes sp. NPDC051633 TaxID=3155670 RepID=UPI003424EE67